MTFVAGSSLAAAHLNIYLLDNLKETEAAKASTTGRIFVANGANVVVEREVASASIGTSETTTATSYGNLATAGPTVTVTTGAQAIVGIAARMSNNQVAGTESMSFGVTGATTLTAADWDAVKCQSAGSSGSQNRMGVVRYCSGLTAGSNTFTCKYKTSAGTATFNDRHIWVMAL